MERGLRLAKPADSESFKTTSITTLTTTTARPATIPMTITMTTLMIMVNKGMTTTRIFFLFSLSLQKHGSSGTTEEEGDISAVLQMGQLQGVL